MRNKYGAIVIGGGYFGCACSYFLAKAGVPTLLLEEKEISRGASGANFGNVQVQDASMGQSYELTLAGFARMKTMTEELGCDIGYQSYPSLIGAESEEHLPELERLFQEKKEAGLDVYWLEGDALQEAEHNLAPGTVLAASYFEQWRVYPFHYQYALVRQGRRYGLEVREFSTVSSLLVEGGVCTGVMLADGTTVRAEHVIVTSGAGTRPLCATAITATSFWPRPPNPTPRWTRPGRTVPRWNTAGTSGKRSCTSFPPWSRSPSCGAGSPPPPTRPTMSPSSERLLCPA